MATIPSQSQVIKFGVFEVDLAAGEVRKAGMRQKVAGQPFQVLQALLQRPKEIVTREELREHLWPGNTFVDYELALKKAVNRLREVLGDSAENPRYIETVPRRGYRFIGTLNGVAHTASPEAPPARRLGIRVRLALLTVLSFLTLTAVLLALNVHGWRNRILAHTPRPQIQALAVLPLANLSGDPEQEYFADGITDALITELGRISSQRVISRQSIMQYKGSKKSLNEIAGELKVDAVLEGTVERSGDQVRVGVRLNRVSPEGQLWSNQYNRDIRDLLRLQDEIARTITDEIQIKLTPQERARLASAAHPVDPGVQDAYLRGRFFWNRGRFFFISGTSRDRTEVDLQTAIGYFKRAIEKDPDYALAYAGLADAYIELGHGGNHSQSETLPEAKAAATKASELDPSLGEAHFSLAQTIELYDWNWSEAEKEYKLALELNPNYADARLEYGRFLQALGRNDEATAQVNYAIELDPLNFRTMDIVGYVTYASRQYDLAIEQFSSLGDDLGLGWAYREKKMYPEATNALERCLSRSGRHDLPLATLAGVYGLAGRRGEALKLIDELKARAQLHFVPGSVFVEAYIGLGEKNRALGSMERAYEDHDQQMVYIKAHPGYDALRSEPRFQVLVSRMNFPP
jgi:TolB-like protein/DNA-binding winged helix-turn-helix (wHTH) protein